jgi:hypothetical protein
MVVLVVQSFQKISPFLLTFSHRLFMTVLVLFAGHEHGLTTLQGCALLAFSSVLDLIMQNLLVGPVTARLLAATGLEHMMSRDGSVVRVCDRKISLVYSKPYMIQTGWTFDPAKVEPDRLTIPFHSLVGKGAAAWAVGLDGVYHFGGDILPDFTAFPRAQRFPTSGVDWSNLGFVLIATDMNRRHSVSGDSLILVPR